MIPYSKQAISEQDVQQVQKILLSPYLTTGPSVEQFEKDLAEYTGAKFAIACSNGTAALHIACLALGIKAGDIGITSPISFAASANCLEMCQAQAKFVDIDNRYCLDPEQLENYCKKQGAPRVVIPVDFAGVPARLAEIHELAKRFGFFVIEDAAHSIGSAYQVKDIWHKVGCGLHADLTTLSFHPVKNITTGEGGAVLTNNEELARKLRMYRSHGIERQVPLMEKKNEGAWWYEMQELGYNYRLTDFQAALGSSQLKEIEGFKKRRQDLTDRYIHALTGKEWLKLPPTPKDASVCRHLFPIVLRGGAAMRRFVYDFLKARDIYCQVHYIPIHLQPYYAHKYKFSSGMFPNAESYYEGCLSIPLYATLTDGEQDCVIEALHMAIDAFEEKRAR